MKARRSTVGLKPSEQCCASRPAAVERQDSSSQAAHRSRPAAGRRHAHTRGVHMLKKKTWHLPRFPSLLAPRDNPASSSSDEDMTPMHMTMFGAWYGGLGGQQGCPSQERGPRLIQFESPRWRPKATKVRARLGVQEQHILKMMPRSHMVSVFNNPHMDGKLIR